MAKKPASKSSRPRTKPKSPARKGGRTAARNPTSRAAAGGGKTRARTASRKPASRRPASKRANPRRKIIRRKKPARPPHPLIDLLFGSFWRKTAFAAFTLAVWGIVGTSALVSYFSEDLPDTSSIWSYANRPSIAVYDRYGKEITTRGDAYGLSVSLHELPPQLPQAVIAVEDRRFYLHHGIDIVGIARAAVTNAAHGRVIQGGSTITQQLARNLFLTSDRTLKRKVQEVLLAFRLESRFTKDQILSLYLNRVYFGAGAYGVEAASQRYFDRSAKSLSLYQSAVLAGLLKAPSRYAPHKAPDKAHARALVVLRTMKEAGYVSEDDIAHALENTRLAATAGNKTPNHFVDWINTEIEREMVSAPSDLHVYTTLDPALQDLATRTLTNAIARDGAEFGFSEAAMVVLDATGAVRAMVGGKSYNLSQFNRATQAKRQPGSAFKPVVYLAALQKGLKPWSIVADTPVRVGNWTPQNYANQYLGQVSLTTALAKSLNAATVRIAQYVGTDAIIATARELGIQSKLSNNLSIALGTSEVSLLELSSVYVPFMNGGNITSYHGIARMETAGGHPLFEAATQPQAKLPFAVVGEMNEMLSQVLVRGTGRAASLGDRPAAGKTGTTQSNRDAWFIGYTRDLLAGIWLGNDDATPMHKSSTGGNAAAVIWAEFMSAATADAPVRKLAGQEITVRDIYRADGLPTGALTAPQAHPDETDIDQIANLIERTEAR